MSDTPLVSVIVRTYDRPKKLCAALESLEAQRFKDFEVVVIEDGEEKAGKLIKKRFPDLDIVYEAMGKNVGRSAAGNRGMELARGKYINFLDDDDILFPAHIGVLVKALKTGENRAAYAVAEERLFAKCGDRDAPYKVKKKFVRHRQPFNRTLLCHVSYLPIQCVMFERSLFTELGGLDEGLDALEDWDLFVRYATATDLTFVDRVTSAYYCPYSEKENASRAMTFIDARERVLEKFKTYEMRVSASSLTADAESIIRDYKTNEVVRAMRTAYEVVFRGAR